MSVSINKKKRKIPLIVKLLLFAVIAVAAARLVSDYVKNEVYPRKYYENISKYSQLYGIDENFVYAVIKTESNFNEKALSEVGARGLMQIMEDAYDWVKFRISDNRDITYDQMFEPEFNIEYGSFMLAYYYAKYESYELAAAAYHSGMGSVDGWIKDGLIDLENVDIENIPSDKTRHYIKKVMKAFNAYNNLY